jgi:hypothetical protein
MNKLVFIKKYIPEELLHFTGTKCWDIFYLGDGTCKLVGRYDNYFIDTSTFSENINKYTPNVNIYVMDEDEDRYLSYGKLIDELKVLQLGKLINKL